MKVAVVINGSSQHVSSIQSGLASASVSADQFITTKPGEARALTRKAIKQGAEVVIAAGGDGTLNEVVNGWMDQPPHTCCIGLLPAGSANDFARLFPAASIQDLLTKVSVGKAQQIDLVRVDVGNTSKHLINIAACGIGAEIACTVNQRRKRLLPAVNYYSAIVSWLMRYKAPLVRIHLDNDVLEKRCFLLAVGKGTYAGNGLGLLPQTLRNDGLLGFTLIEAVTVFDFLRYQNTLKRGAYVKDKRVHYLKSSHVEMEVLDGQLAVDTDGEFLLHLKKGQKATFTVMPSALKWF